MASEVPDHNLASKSYPMVGGDGPHSYSHNSVYQKYVNEAARKLISESIAEKFDLDSDLFRIADLGCSVGPNTFSAVENIIDSIENKPNMIKSQPSFHVFFNDHTENDFNTLFRSLPPSRRYSAAGVPGSFHGRLFPKSTLHFVHTSYSLHWLSEIPREVVDPVSPAWNGGNIYCSGRVEAADGAYAAQFSNDVEAFLSARAQEVVGGGLMAITVGGLRAEELPCSTTVGFVFDLIGSCLSDLAILEITSKEKVESFNVPLYHPRKEEFLEVVRKNENFSIERVEVFSINYQKVKTPLAPFLTAQFRAFLGDLIAKHFGSEIVDHLFQLLCNKLEESIQNNSLSYNSPSTNIFTLLKRKM